MAVPYLRQLRFKVTFVNSGFYIYTSSPFILPIQFVHKKYFFVLFCPTSETRSVRCFQQKKLLTTALRLWYYRSNEIRELKKIKINALREIREMDAFSIFKAMKVKNITADKFSFRTSRSCYVLGCLFIMAGLGIMFQVFINAFSTSLMSFCFGCLIVALLFIFSGVTLIIYRRKVNINVSSQKIDISQSGISGYRRSTYHFSEISSLELAKDNECLLSLHTDLWIVRGYIKHHRTIFVERLFATMSFSEAKEIMEKLSYTIKANAIISTDSNGAKGLGHKIQICKNPTLRTIS